MAWYRALQSAGCYGDAILFDDASAMYAHCEQAPEVAVCIALADESAAGGFAMVSHGRYRLLRKTQAVCKLGPIKEQDAEQVLRGTADGKRVVEFELATEELRELQAEETSKAAEEAAAKVEKDKAEAAAQELLANELNPLREKIKQLKEATGTPASSKKRARSS